MSTTTGTPIDPTEHPIWRSLIRVGRGTITHEGWIPKTDIPELEEMRVEHDRRCAIRTDTRQVAIDLRDKFDGEGEARQDELNASYAEGREPDLPALTPPDERETAISEAGAHHSAAARAVRVYAISVIERLQGTVPADWHFAEAASSNQVPPGGEAAVILAGFDKLERNAQEALQEARRAAEEADRRFRSLKPLRYWLIKNANVGNGSAPPISAHVFETDAPEWTTGSKPRDQYVEGWWDDGETSGTRSLDEPDAADSAGSKPLDVAQARADLDAALAEALAEDDPADDIATKEL